MDIEKKFSYCGKYTVLRTLGSGYHAKVKLAQDPETQTFYAIKIFKSNHALASNIKALANEINIMKTLNHPNLVNLIEYQENFPYQKKSGKKDSRVCIVLELAQGGELFEFVAQTGRFSMEASRFYFKQIVEALQYLHTHGVAHRDLKPENILFDANFNLKLADFGFATLCNKNADGKLTSTLGTAGYMAPEINQKIPYDGKLVDIFAAGVILFIIYAGSPPFSAAQPNDPYFKLLIQNKNEQFWNFHSKHKGDPNFFPQDLRTLLNGMLHPDPSKRFTIEQVIQSQWLNGQASTLEQILNEFPRRKQIVDNEIEKERIKKQLEKAHKGNALQKGIGKFRSTSLSEKVYNFDKIEGEYKLNDKQRRIKKFYGEPMNAFITLEDKDFILRYLLQFFDKYCNKILNIDENKYKLTAILEQDNEEPLTFAIELREVDDVQINVDFQKLEGETLVFHKSVEKIKKLIEQA